MKKEDASLRELFEEVRLQKTAVKNINLKKLASYKWMEEIWKWADKNNITDHQYIDEYGGFGGSIPRNRQNLFYLLELHLRNNNIIELPSELFNLINLIYLDLSYNKLSKISKDIEKLTNLETLNLGCNKLIELPREIGKLDKLEKLILKENNIKKLPKEIGNLKNLITLDLSYNQLKELPNEIVNLKKLKELNLFGFLSNTELVLTQVQKKWINELKDNGCKVYEFDADSIPF